MIFAVYIKADSRTANIQDAIREYLAALEDRLRSGKEAGTGCFWIGSNRSAIYT